MKKRTKNIIWIVISSLIALSFLFIGDAIRQSRGFGDFEFNRFNNLPNYLVFIATGISAGLLYMTLNDQSKANQVAAFENRFFKFIDYHRDNVAQMRYTNPDNSDENKIWNNSQVFMVIHYQVRDLLVEFFKNCGFKDPDVHQKKIAVAFVYQCVLYGAGEDGIRILKTMYRDHPEYFDYINFENRKVERGALKHVNTEHTVKDADRKYYSGHARRLGHYYRNMYQAIKYVDEQKFLSEKDKYHYVKTYRAQMSVYEQLVFFYSSLSKSGESWEWEEYLKPCPTDPQMRQRSFDNLLITKYNLIRNTLYNDVYGEVTNGIFIKDFYPLMNLEHEEKCSIYGKLRYEGYDKIDNNNICRFCFNEKYKGSESGNYEEKIREYFTKEQLLRDNEENNNFICNEPDCKSMPIINELRRKFAIV
jgi:hypothetical protein